MENKQQVNHGNEQQVGGQSLANHHWQAVLVALTHEEEHEYDKSFDVLGREVFQVRAGGSLGLLG